MMGGYHPRKPFTQTHHYKKWAEGKRLPSNVPCPLCAVYLCGVIDSRMTLDGIRRRRMCMSCGHRWTTYEVHEDRFDRTRQDLGWHKLTTEQRKCVMLTIEAFIAANNTIDM